MADPSANQVIGVSGQAKVVQDDSTGTPSSQSVRGVSGQAKVVLDELVAVGGLSIPVAIFSYRQHHQGG